MSMPIDGMSVPRPPVANPSAAFGGAARPEAAGSPFQRLLIDSLSEVDAMQQQAQTAVEQSLSGGNVSQAEVLMSMKKADLAMRMMLQIRNKLFEAYDEIKQLRM